MQTIEAGTAFGPYVIDGFIAGGGMGQVYAAHHSVYGTAVAMKVLHADLHADADWRRRFNEEGVVGTQLKHPHVLAARELVQHEGRVALVIDLVFGGQTLLKVVTREFATGVPLVSALQVLLCILQGVEYAHTKGVIHGDIKPENVLLAGDFRDPMKWVPLVTDFGTVGLIAHPVVIDGQIAVVASPRYASPEHMYGVDRIERRSDIYSLGLLLHFLLTGRHVSDARTVQEAAERVMRPIPVALLVDQPDQVIALIQKACAVRPDDRFATCREFALAIRKVLDDLGVRLSLEDLQAELATEVIEERRDLREQSAPTGGMSGEPLAPSAVEHPEDQPTELVGNAPQEPAMKPKPPEPHKSADDGEEPARNPLWGMIGTNDGEDDDEAPTARLTPDRVGGVLWTEKEAGDTHEHSAGSGRRLLDEPAPPPHRPPAPTQSSHVVTIPEFAPPEILAKMPVETAPPPVRQSQIDTAPSLDTGAIHSAMRASSNAVTIPEMPSPSVPAAPPKKLAERQRPAEAPTEHLAPIKAPAAGVPMFVWIAGAVAIAIIVLAVGWSYAG